MRIKFYVAACAYARPVFIYYYIDTIRDYASLSVFATIKIYAGVNINSVVSIVVAGAATLYYRCLRCFVLMISEGRH